MQLNPYRNKLREKSFTNPTNSLSHWVEGKRVDEPDAQCFFRTNLFSGYEHLQRAALADQSRQALSSSPARDESQGGTAMSENGVGGSNAMMTSERQVKPATHAVSGNRDVHRSRELFQVPHELLTYLGEFIGGRTVEGRNFFQLCPGGEESVVPGKNERPRFTRKFPDRCSQRKNDIKRETIGSVVRLQADDTRVLAFIKLKESLGHRE